MSNQLQRRRYMANTKIVVKNFRVSTQSISVGPTSGSRMVYLYYEGDELLKNAEGVTVTMSGTGTYLTATYSETGGYVNVTWTRNTNTSSGRSRTISVSYNGTTRTISFSQGADYETSRQEGEYVKPVVTGSPKIKIGDSGLGSNGQYYIHIYKYNCEMTVKYTKQIIGIYYASGYSKSEYISANETITIGSNNESSDWIQYFTSGQSYADTRSTLLASGGIGWYRSVDVSGSYTITYDGANTATISASSCSVFAPGTSDATNNVSFTTGSPSSATF